MFRRRNVRNALARPQRIGEFQKALGLAKNIPTARLRKLVEAETLETLPAPAHHFSTLTGLRTALAAIGYQRFGAAMRDECLDAPDPEARMRAASRGYLAFALSQPGLFRLMFTKELLDWTHPDLAGQAAAARAQLSTICAPAAERLRLDAAARRALEHLVWATVHSQAQLAIDGQLGPAHAPADLPGPESGCPDIATLLFRMA